MNVTSTSLSHIFLAMFLIALVFFLYFKSLVVKTSPENQARKKIIGNMHDPEEWRKRNSNMANLSAFWGILSLIIFIYLKFFYGARLLSLNFLLIYLAVEVVSIIFFGIRKKASQKTR